MQMIWKHWIRNTLEFHHIWFFLKYFVSNGNQFIGHRAFSTRMFNTTINQCKILRLLIKNNHVREYKVKSLKAISDLKLIQWSSINHRNAYILSIHIVHSRTLFLCEHIYSVIWQQYLIMAQQNKNHRQI